jgi:hypothetical protein
MILSSFVIRINKVESEKKKLHRVATLMYEISQKVSKNAIKLTVPVWNTIKKKKNFIDVLTIFSHFVLIKFDGVHTFVEGTCSHIKSPCLSNKLTRVTSIKG